MVEKVTKEERMATLMKEAAEKAIEILGNKDDFMDEDLTGEEVKAKKPKAEKVKDASGGDEQADNRTRDAVGSDGNQLKKMRQIPISPHMLEGRGQQDKQNDAYRGFAPGGNNIEIPPIHEHKWVKLIGDDFTCDDGAGQGEEHAEHICVKCGYRVCARHMKENRKQKYWGL